MRPLRESRPRQRGAIALIVALTLCVLIGLLGLVLDLAHLAVRKTELQNAADAAALAAVRALDGEAAGIDAAVDAAISMAQANASDFARTPVAIAADQLAFATSPDGPWLSAGEARSQPSGIGFVRVDTRGIAQGTRNTWFAPLLAVFTPGARTALASTTAEGQAVAGARLCEGVPLFICPPPGGFLPGHAYFFADQPGSPVGPGNLGYFDPVPAGAPSLLTGANDMRNVLCAGKTHCLGPGTYSSLTQSAFGTMARAFNSRFDDYQGLPTNLTPEICRPDTNVKEYPYPQVNWMTTNPVRQAESNGLPGVRWSAVVPPAAAAGEVNARYPAQGAPYEQSAGSAHHRSPASAHQGLAQSGRRILTMAVGGPSACDGSINGSGHPVEIIGFARFFLPVKAVGTGGNRGIYVEYLGRVTRLMPSAPDITLYR